MPRPSAVAVPRKKGMLLAPIFGALLVLGIGAYTWNTSRQAVAPAPDAPKSLGHLYTLAPNADFEVPNMASWTVSGQSVTNTINPEAEEGEAVNGKASMTFYSKTPYDITVRQTITGLKPGKYTLRAWSKQGKAEKTAEMFVDGYGGARCAVPLSKGWTWTLISIPDIQVTAGQCNIGFAMKGAIGGVGNVDAVEFLPQ